LRNSNVLDFLFQFLLGHSLSLSALAIILLSFCNLIICQTQTQSKGRAKITDLLYSDTNHGQTAAAQQQVVFIDHGGGAVSQIRRTSYIQPNPAPVPSLPFRPHVNHYPNSLFENDFIEEPEPYFNFPEDIPRIFERRVGETTPNPNDIEPQTPPTIPFIAPEIRPQHPPEIRLQHRPEIQPQHRPEIQLQHRPEIRPQHLPQELPQPKIDEENVIIPKHIEPQRIHPIRPSLPSHPTHPTIPPHPIYPPSPQIQNENPINPFLNFAQPPEIFPNFESPFDAFSPQIPPLFQRRRLTLNNNVQDFNQNSIGYPAYNYYKGGGDDNPSLTNWPKIFKFTDGRANLFEFEKQKKHNKIKFMSKETYFDNISRYSFLILHGGTYTQ